MKAGDGQALELGELALENFAAIVELLPAAGRKALLNVAFETFAELGADQLEVEWWEQS